MRTLTRVGPRKFIASSSAPRKSFGSSTMTPCRRGLPRRRPGGVHHPVVAGAALSHLAHGAGVLGDDRVGGAHELVVDDIICLVQPRFDLSQGVAAALERLGAWLEQKLLRSPRKRGQLVTA
jgi:hypothetical protein